MLHSLPHNNEKQVPEPTEISRSFSIDTKVEGQLFDRGDHVLRHNLALYNHAIEQVGFGRYQLQLFFTCGFGFVVDQMLTVSIGLVIPQIVKQWNVEYASMLVAALYAGALVGAVLCGFAIDYVGRRIVWQTSLFVVTILTMIAASSPNFTALAIFIGFQGIGAGGNIAIDVTVFAESLPKDQSYLLCALLTWWGVGNTIGGLLAWPLISHFCCPEDATPVTCSSAQNMGWRYQYILIGGLTLGLAIVRVTFMKMEESPKWLVSQGQYGKAIEALEVIAKVNKSSLHITKAEFVQMPAATERKVSDKTITHAAHIRGIFATKKLAMSTSGLIVLWMCIGIAYPLYTLFLPVYLENNGAELGNGSTYQTYRDYVIVSVVGISGPIVATALVNAPVLGRRRSMAVAALCAAAFAGAFTSVRNESGNLAFSSLFGFWQNAFYAILYSYTPEVMPTAHRGTGCGLTLAMGRIASLSSPFIETYADLNTSAPIWVCLGLYVLIAIIAVLLPFEPKAFSAHEQP